MTKPATSSTYNPYSDMDADKKKSDAATADSVSAEPVYKLVIDENVVEKISSMAAQKIDGIIDMKGNVLSRIQEGLGGADKTKGVDADIVDDTNAKINLDVIMEYSRTTRPTRPGSPSASCCGAVPSALRTPCCKPVAPPARRAF